MKHETKFKKKVLEDLKTLKNAWFFKANEVSVRGIPDVILCLNGLFVAIELKKDSLETADPLQTYNGEKIVQKGKGIFYLASPDTWHDVLLKLHLLDRSA